MSPWTQLVLTGLLVLAAWVAPVLADALVARVRSRFDDPGGGTDPG